MRYKQELEYVELKGSPGGLKMTWIRENATNSQINTQVLLMDQQNTSATNTNFHALLYQLVPYSSQKHRISQKENHLRLHLI